MPNENINEYLITINGCRGIPIDFPLEFGRDYEITMKVRLVKKELADKQKNNEFAMEYKVAPFEGLGVITPLEYVKKEKKEDE